MQSSAARTVPVDTASQAAVEKRTNEDSLVGPCGGIDLLPSTEFPLCLSAPERDKHQHGGDSMSVGLLPCKEMTWGPDGHGSLASRGAAYLSTDRDACSYLWVERLHSFATKKSSLERPDPKGSSYE